MKNIVALCLSCFVFFNQAMAQMDITVLPASRNLTTQINGNISEIKLPALSDRELELLDYNDSKNGHMPHIARNINTNITLANAGKWTSLPNGDAIWRVKVSSAGAHGLVPLFDQLYLPPGATLHIYMPGNEETLGAFTHANTPNGARAFCCGLIHGPVCIIEYYEPAAQKGNGILSIDKVGYAYRWVTSLSKGLESGAGSCEVNVACSEGDNWRDQIKAVARIFVVDNGGEGYCSGTMINNVRKDCTPYMLSAEHCTENGVSASQFSQWVFLFNYQGAQCADTTGPQTDIVNGCVKIADSEDDGGATGSDFLLLQLNNIPPPSYNIFYAGWDITNITPTSGADMHHPEADIKKISTFSNPAQTTSWGDTAQNTHWLVQWSATANGHGVTEPGSSGSPLFSQSALVVGHLTGGGSCCIADACNSNPSIPTGPNIPDYFGKIAYDWTSNGVSSSMQLKPWLDPDNTGTTTLQGMYPPCGTSVNNDAGIQAINAPNGNVCTSTIAPVVVLRNFGGNTLNSVTLTYRFDNGTFSPYSWTGSLAAGTTVEVTLPTVSLTSGAHTFTVVSTDPNNTTDANPANDTLSSTLFVTNEGGSLDLTLTTDDVGSKTTWQITDQTNNVVASGGPYPNLKGGTTYNIPFCLPLACYTFTIFSSTGDGMDNGVAGNFVLSGQAGTIIYDTLTTPSFGSQEAHNFCVLASTSGIKEIPGLDISVIPNPSTGQFKLVTDNSEIKTIKVFDVTGSLLLEMKTAGQNVILDLSAESKGIYIMQIETVSGRAVKKLVLK